MKIAPSKFRRQWLPIGIGILLVTGFILHFVPIRQEEGFIAEEVDMTQGTTCEAVTVYKRYRLILNELSEYNQTKNKFGKNIADLTCPPGANTVIYLYLL